MPKRTPEQIARAKEAKVEKLSRQLRTQWVDWGSRYYVLYTTCTNCEEVHQCRGRYRDTVRCENCHFIPLEKYSTANTK